APHPGLPGGARPLWARVTQLDTKDPLEHEAEVIGLVVLMPDEGTVEFGHHDVVSIELGDGPRREMVGKLPFRVAVVAPTLPPTRITVKQKGPGRHHTDIPSLSYATQPRLTAVG